jgi:hypothetical protein
MSEDRTPYDGKPQGAPETETGWIYQILKSVSAASWRNGIAVLKLEKRVMDLEAQVKAMMKAGVN